jgi:tetratricopeptide (TPR) repeat protein
MSVEDLYEKAREAVERNNFEYAVRLYRDLLRQRPEFPNARIALRGTERRLQGEAGPLRYLTIPVQMLVATVKALLAGKRKKLEVYEDFLEKNPNSFWGLSRAAGAAAGLGYNEEAITMYKDALRRKPRDKGALRALGDLLKEEARLDEAMQYLGTLAELEPTNRDLQRELRDLTATGHMTAHEMESAESFRDLIRDRDEAERLERASRAEGSADELERRIGELEQELEEDPESVPRVLKLAQLYVDTGRLKDAQEMLKARYEAMPDNYEIREWLGDVQLMVYEQALKTARQQVEENPRDEKARQRLRQIEERHNEFGIKEYRWRLEQHPTDRHLQLQLGQYLFEAGDYDAAIAAFQAALQDARYELEARKMLGRCFQAKNQPDLALQQFEAALEAHPQMDEAGKELRYCKASAHEAMGERQKALDAYKRVYSEDINYRDVSQKVDQLSG